MCIYSDHLIPVTHLKEVPSKLSPQDLLVLISSLEKAIICEGQSDDKYYHVTRHRCGKFYDASGMFVILLEKVL